MYPWFGWSIPVIYIAFANILFFALIGSKIRIFESHIQLEAKDLVILLGCLWINNYSISSLVLGLLLWINILLLTRFKKTVKKEIVRFITKYFSILCGISLGFFLLYRIGVPLPHTNIHFQDTQGLEGYGYIDNYYSFIVLLRSEGLRFQSVFVEPGHFSMGLCTLLYLNKYNIKNKYVIILLLSQLFSFSLAGYILLIVGYILTSFSKRNVFKVSSTIVLSALFIFIIIRSFGYFYEDDILQSLIFDRLFTNGDLNNLSNRTGESFALVYQQFLKTTDVIWGMSISYKTENEGSSGFAPYLYVHGIIGVLSIIYIYYKSISKRKNWEAYKFLLFLFVILYQNAYPFWWCMLIVLTCGVSYMEDMDKVSIAKK